MRHATDLDLHSNQTATKQEDFFGTGCGLWSGYILSGPPYVRREIWLANTSGYPFVHLATRFCENGNHKMELIRHHKLTKSVQISLVLKNFSSMRNASSRSQPEVHCHCIGMLCVSVSRALTSHEWIEVLFKLIRTWMEPSLFGNKWGVWAAFELMTCQDYLNLPLMSLITLQKVFSRRSI